jgi:hypothetical protein
MPPLKDPVPVLQITDHIDGVVHITQTEVMTPIRPERDRADIDCYGGTRNTLDIGALHRVRAVLAAIVTAGVER